MTNYLVTRRCFYNGELYLKGSTLELNDEMVVHNYRVMGYIGKEIPTAKRKGRKKVRKNAVNAK